MYCETKHIDLNAPSYILLFLNNLFGINIHFYAKPYTTVQYKDKVPSHYSRKARTTA